MTMDLLDLSKVRAHIRKHHTTRAPEISGEKPDGTKLTTPELARLHSQWHGAKLVRGRGGNDTWHVTPDDHAHGGPVITVAFGGGIFASRPLGAFTTEYMDEPVADYTDQPETITERRPAGQAKRGPAKNPRGPRKKVPADA